MRVVDQNSLITHIVQLKRTSDYGSEDRSLNLFEGTKDDTKRRMVSVERRDAKVHTKDK